MTKIMTFNIRGAVHDDGENAWPKRAALNVETIRRADPDLIGFQEFQDGNREYYDRELTGYERCVGPRYGNAEPYEYAAIYWKPDRLSLVDSGGFWLSTTPDEYSGAWETVCIRCAAWVRLRPADGGREFLHLNTPGPPFRGGASPGRRTHSAAARGDRTCRRTRGGYRRLQLPAGGGALSRIHERRLHRRPLVGGRLSARGLRYVSRFPRPRVLANPPGGRAATDRLHPDTGAGGRSVRGAARRSSARLPQRPLPSRCGVRPTQLTARPRDAHTFALLPSAVG
ncbi:MAG: endonuclease/exonuclease/phosphatase family protein [Chloroflexia bacterium]